MTTYHAQIQRLDDDESFDWLVTVRLELPGGELTKTQRSDRVSGGWTTAEHVAAHLAFDLEEAFTGTRPERMQGVFFGWG